MEASPLRFLDNDVSLMLSERVRLSKEEFARQFHSYNFENSHEINLNNQLHYKISDVFDNNSFIEIFNYLEDDFKEDDIKENKVKIISGLINNFSIEY
tara:strand:+ start:416 stop:709 length:294 start_codon:yes stop_codon:yes gene_type:complete